MKKFRRKAEQRDPLGIGSPFARRSRITGAGSDQENRSSGPALEGGTQPDAPESALLWARWGSEQPAVGPHLAEGLQEQWRAYRKQLKQCQQDFSTGNVHELRVQTRRLMAQLVLIGHVLPVSSSAKARRILKRRLAVLGQIRDTHVQLEFVAAKRRQFPGLRPFRDHLRRLERRLTKPTAKKVKRFKTAKLGRWISALREDLTRKANDLGRQTNLAWAAWQATDRSFQEVLRRRAAIDPADMKTIHRTRVAFKRFRYMIECSPIDMLRPGERELEVLAAYQRKMGNIQDTEVLLHVVGEFGQKHKSAQGELDGFIQSLLRRRARLLHIYLASANDLLRFWPPAGTAVKAPLR